MNNNKDTILDIIGLVLFIASVIIFLKAQGV